MSWGCIDSEGKITVPEHDYVHILSIRKVFRCKFENALIELFDMGRLEHDFHNRRDWIVHLEPPIQMPKQVIQYVGRYSKRACLSEYKITAMDGENISFRYRNYKNSPDRRNPVEKELTLHYREFFPQLLQHVYRVQTPLGVRRKVLPQASIASLYLIREAGSCPRSWFSLILRAVSLSHKMLLRASIKSRWYLNM